MVGSGRFGRAAARCYSSWRSPLAAERMGKGEIVLESEGGSWNGGRRRAGGQGGGTAEGWAGALCFYGVPLSPFGLEGPEGKVLLGEKDGG